MTAHAIDVTSDTFEKEVLEASKTVLVVVDFWAPWCGPCKVLKPLLEKLAEEYGGRFRLAKVNSDENPQVSSAYGIRSIPDVMAFRDGKAVSHFLGAQPESQVRAFIDGLLPKPSEIERAKAEGLRARGDVEGAMALLVGALELDQRNDLARLDLSELLIEADRADEALPLLEAVRPDASLDARVEALRAAAGFSNKGGAGEAELKAKLAADPADHEARLALASLAAGAHRYAEAMDALLEIVRRDKDWKDGEARKQVVNILNLAATDADLVSTYRRKLASALY